MMAIRKFYPIAFIFIFALVIFTLHKLLFYYAGVADSASQFYHPLESVYVFFSICSAVIVAILVIVRKNSIDNVGQLFLLLTCAKMGIAYAYLHPVLENAAPNLPFERMNFFVTFAIFLTLETVLTVRILNRE
jgi:phosphoglycerol transferase MdoB-like AlkP superfamily enzyme